MARRRDSHRREETDVAATRELVDEILRTAMAFEDVVVSVLDSLPPDAVYSEDPGLVLLEMIVGSVHPATRAVGPRDTAIATALIGAIRERVLTDLHTAAHLDEDENDPEPPARKPEK